MSAMILQAVISLVDYSGAKRLWREDRFDFSVGGTVRIVCGLCRRSVLTTRMVAVCACTSCVGQVMAVACVGTLLVGVEIGVLLAILLSLVLFIFKASLPRVVELGRIHGGWTCLAGKAHTQLMNVPHNHSDMSS